MLQFKLCHMTTYRQKRSLIKLPSPNKPSRHKLFLLTWLAIYPLITIILYCFSKPLNLLPLPILTLILTGVLVYLMTYWVMPMWKRIKVCPETNCNLGRARWKLGDDSRAFVCSFLITIKQPIYRAVFF